MNLKNLPILFLGLAIFGVGDALLIQSTIGNSPWSVFAQGLSLRTPLSVGEATAITSIGVLLLWIPLRERPGFGTLANIAVIAIFIQIGVNHIPEVEMNFPLQILYVLIGIGFVGLGSALYITCGLGPGPRDGLMTSIHNRTGIRIARVRLGIEVTILIIGALLGGSVGLGTAMFGKGDVANGIIAVAGAGKILSEIAQFIYSLILESVSPYLDLATYFNSLVALCIL